MKKLLNVLCWIGVAALCTISFVSAYTQEEISAYNWAYRNGITTQATIDSAKLDWKLTRQELSKMLTNYIENVAWVKQTFNSSCLFTDEDEIIPNLKPYARKICSYQIMWSDWQKFRPTSKVTRAELWTTISRMLWWDKHNVSWKDFYIYHLNALKDHWIMNNIENPTKSLARRWDTFIMLKRLSDKFGSNINLNSWSVSYSYSYTFDTSNLYNDNSSTSDDDRYISLFGKSDVIYTWEDGTKYYYDTEFLKMLKWLADKKWETDLSNFLKIQIDFSEESDRLEELLNDDEFLEEIFWTSMEDDFQELSQREKEEAIKKVKIIINKLKVEVEEKWKKYVKDLNNVVKNTKDDQFWLKENYEKSKDYVESTTAMASTLVDTIITLVEAETLSNEASDEELMWAAFGLLWVSLTLQSLEVMYETYQQEWATNAINILNGWSASIKKDNKSAGSANLSYFGSYEAAQLRARDVSRKTDLSQIQSAIVTSQTDKGYWPWMNKWATKWIDVSDISGELMAAWMSRIPSDPVENSIVRWLWSYSSSKWNYSYLVTTRNGVSQWGFVLMAKTEIEWWSNWVVCESGSWLDKWYIQEWTDISKIQTCTSFKKWNTCSSNNTTCYYTDEEELRYILLY